MGEGWWVFIFSSEKLSTHHTPNSTRTFFGAGVLPAGEAREVELGRRTGSTLTDARSEAQRSMRGKDQAEDQAESVCHDAPKGAYWRTSRIGVERAHGPFWWIQERRR